MPTHRVPQYRRHRRPLRFLATVLILMILGMATACGGQDEPPAASSPQASSPQASSPQATAPSADANTQWADSVCRAANDVRSSLDAIGTDLAVDPNAGEGGLDQVKAQLKTQVAAARASTTDLKAAIDAIPADEAGAAELKSSLDDARTNLDASVQAVSDGVAETTAATDAKGFVTAGVETLKAVKAASTSADTFVTTARAGASKAGGSLQAAFDSAPSCAVPSATPS